MTKVNYHNIVAGDQQWEQLTDTWAKIQSLYPEANFLQSPAWGKMNRMIGHKVMVDTTDKNWCLMIVKNAKRGRYLEIPGGPLIDWGDSAAVREIFQRIRQIAQAEGCVFVRLRPQLKNSVQNLQTMQSLGLRPAPMHLHAEHTVILDLTKSANDLLAAMRRQTRYEVRRAAKSGITTTVSNSEEIFREFHQVQMATAARQHFVPPDLETLLAEREAFGDHAQIYRAQTARTQTAGTAPNVQTIEPASSAKTASKTQTSEPSPSASEPIAYGLILVDGTEAAYFEAASTELNRKLPGSYALLWQAIQDLQKQGIQRLNLWGIAPSGQKEHRYAGVTTFKTGFGGEIIEFMPAQDIIIKRGRYLINLLIETIRKKKRHLG